MSTRTTNYVFAHRKYHANYWVKRYNRTDKLGKNIVKFTLTTWIGTAILGLIEIAVGIL